jgi:D-alanine-D-alanine ligase
MNRNKIKQVLLLCGGNGTEHQVSTVSAKYVEETVRQILECKVTTLELKGNYDLSKILQEQNPDIVIPCIHGPPGETGDIQSLLELLRFKYLGCGPEASRICFNKVSSKLWFSALDIPNTPFIFLSENNTDFKNKALKFYREQKGKVFIKASSQGSSVGCYLPSEKDEKDFTAKVDEAFKHSPFVLIEEKVDARELEISVYEFQGKIVSTVPGEIICPGKFYSYDEKYSSVSQTRTELVAEGLTADQISTMRKYAERAFVQLKLRHLSRVDFFLTQGGKIYLNEINTFPGMTPISMFPKMMENHGHKFKDFIEEIVKKTLDA